MPETNITEPTIPQTLGQPKLYNVNQYSFIGFFLGLFPVFFMSFNNSKILPNGEEIKTTMKKFFIAYIALFVGIHALIVWGVVTLTNGLIGSISQNPSSYTNFLLRDEIPSNLGYVEQIVQNGSNIFLFANIILLIVVTRFVNKHELPGYKEMIDSKKAQVNTMLIPVVIGIIYVIYIFGFSTKVSVFIAEKILGM